MASPYPTTSEKYRTFRDWVWSSAASHVNDPGDSTPWELEVQAQWFGGEFGRNFKGTDGEEIEIVQFGHWNRGTGPDFTEAAVRISGELHTGSIEIDMDARSWETHGHGGNPEFDNVILHVFTDGPALHRFYTRTSQHRNICQLQLPQYTSLQGPPDYLPEAFPGRCLTPLAKMTDSQIDSILHSASQFRLKEKSARLASMTQAYSRDQVLFQGIAEALGYRQNKTQMAVFAQRNPIDSLRHESPICREARLFGSAGFMTQEIYEDSLSDDSKEYLRLLWSEWWKIRDTWEPAPHRAIPWKLSGSRPMNHPQRRVGALSAIVNSWPEFSSLLDGEADHWVKSIGNFFTGATHPYWENHYTIRSGPSEKPMKLIGEDRVRDILGNILFPLLIRDSPSLWNSYICLKGSGSNQKLRRALLRLFGRDEDRQKEFSRDYFQQQGLLQIFTDFCLEDHSECENCPFPEQLLQWQNP